MPNVLNAAALALNESSEACRLKAYDDKTGETLLKGQKPQGNASIGYGHSGLNPFTGKPIEGGDEWTQAQANQVHRSDLAIVEDFIREHVTMPLTDNQYGALVDFAFNAGTGNLARYILPVVNAGNRAAVPAKLRMFVKSGGKTMPGLVTRRQREATLWNTPDASAPPPPPPVPAPVPSATPDPPSLLARVGAWFEGKYRLPVMQTASAP